MSIDMTHHLLHDVLASMRNVGELPQKMSLQFIAILLKTVADIKTMPSRAFLSCFQCLLKTDAA
jgi:hypothetical protein